MAQEFTKSPLHPDNLLPVPNVSWPSSKGDFTSEMTNGGLPTVLQDTFLTTWPAFKKWKDLKYIHKRLPPQMEVNRVHQPNRTFVHYHPGPQFPMSDTYPATFEKLTIAKSDFWERIAVDRSHLISKAVLERAKLQHANINGEESKTEATSASPTFPAKAVDDGYVYYYNTMLTEWSDQRLLKDVPNYTSLLYRNPTIPHEESNSQGEIKLWIGTQGVFANLHYDATHNFYLQVRGRKRWLLINPKHWKNVYTYPRSHPSDRQSMVNFKDCESEEGWKEIVSKYPKLANVTGDVMEVILEEGDVLYLPPFWFHAVESLDISTVSLNVWSMSKELFLTSNVLLRNVFPFTKSTELTWTKPLTKMGFKLYCALLNAKLGELRGSTLLVEFLDSWTPLSLLSNDQKIEKGTIHPSVVAKLTPILTPYVEYCVNEIFLPMESHNVWDSIFAGYVESVAVSVFCIDENGWRTFPKFVSDCYI